MGPIPPLPPPPSQKPATGVLLEVSKRLLWVGNAAYPLHNITRVHTFVLKPKRAEAVGDFLKWGGLTAIAYAVVRALVETSSAGEGRPQSSQGVGIVCLAVLIVLFGRMVQVLTASPEHVLAVETASSSTAVVTLPDVLQLQRVVDDIVKAIENPDDEFQVLVQSLNFNPKNYHFGDQVNMYGGLGSTGLVKK
ncbi:DUF6232 family protein [Streptomyces sp. NPDC020362]|uniref:DUF6232 family protein n=1 Tax=unclassified Streptomyces TaxID=2593676 RepID=UPI000A4DB9CB